MPCDCSDLVFKRTAKGEREGTENRTEKIKKKKRGPLSEPASLVTLVCNALAPPSSQKTHVGSVTQNSGGQEAEEAAAQTQSSDGCVGGSFFRTPYTEP